MFTAKVEGLLAAWGRSGEDVDAITVFEALNPVVKLYVLQSVQFKSSDYEPDRIGALMNKALWTEALCTLPGSASLGLGKLIDALANFMGDDEIKFHLDKIEQELE